MPSLRSRVVLLVCVGITAPRVGWADQAQAWNADPQRADWVDDPYAPHVTRGTAARLGSVAGFLLGDGSDVFVLGATTAVGYRFNRLTLEAELDYLTLQAQGAGTRIGDGERLGAVARFDVVRLGPRWVGKNSLLAMYVEAGAAVAWNHWYTPSGTERSRDVPADTKRLESQAGFGLMLDHRLEKPIGFPHRIGWLLGWRITGAPEAATLSTVCRGSTSCRVVEPMPEAARDRFVTRSLLFQSSLFATW